MYINTKYQEAFGDEKSSLNNPVQYENSEFLQRSINGSQMPSTAPYQAMNGSQPIYQTQNNFVRGSSKNKIKGVPVNIICPNCHQNVVTIIQKKNGKKMVLAVVGTAIVCWPLAWIPLLVKPLKNKKHICPSCNTNLGKAIYVQTQNF
ncbi:hypothetical protein BB558_004189 [Smittium angustum]|uniref:LITAF domain-containing protein n=1 Tax=Smittium angustum TaxID=133377 RepID=A0A2U1J3Z8_SMIAN|nr:hypothetical protein BB558_004189 [Smittium angustum]